MISWTQGGRTSHATPLFDTACHLQSPIGLPRGTMPKYHIPVMTITRTFEQVIEYIRLPVPDKSASMMPQSLAEYIGE